MTVKTSKRAARGSNSINGRGGISKINRNGKLTGYRAKVLDPNRPGRYITKSFKVGQKEQASSWLKEEIRRMDEAASLGLPYVPSKQRKELERYKTVRFKDFAEGYLEGYRNAATGEAVRPDTMRAKKTAVKHLTDFFKDMLIRDITSKDIRACSEWLEQYGPFARQRAMKEMRTIMRKALLETEERPALISKNPCEGIPLPKVPDSEQAKIPVATKDEIRVIYESMPEYSRIAVYLGAAFGLRISEVCALRVCDIDFKHGLLRVRHSLGRGENDTGPLRLADTKNAASNDAMPIPEGMVNLLKEHVEKYANASSPEAMLISAKRSSILSPNTLRKQFAEAREKAGRSDLHFHTLRATYDTQISRDAENAKDYMAATRRRDVAVGVKHYQRADKKRVRELGNKAFEKLIEPKRTEEVVRNELNKVIAELEQLDSKRQILEAELATFSQ
ncbi:MULTISPECIES: tyrosine-type recombinase/integrase [Bifidobacterium]|uniref:Tyr recombinase domain-containing protein n=1 Tax=Bifidobacterium callitrichidarum TaxID=2052941 RepID=A0A2U2N118_9BIFI|nr:MULTISPECIES: site-specific integrase [Bifidobacterium]MBT1171425.1 tyrosine-type recombinase/integrase [Bifidobacterium sp. SO4]PWG62762.1 hypothetical protein DF196_11715 [Bifidobacterium callitrichidarum]